ncbi:hypothetical protein VW23_007195 [Devosia insulae DS-56]|uniref:Uncharacterized protein n=1 Tax=Devosia insulae DS-56 TaxID=1116389 RepID=A0A1E5XH44_9HYPH|nr:hypothetical protein [Devosia insulae]OEO27916.1 hypothetical protein VW23_007195 [Devosia insulae DS-56]
MKSDPVFVRSIENGIWMCNVHGTLIDRDEATYTPQLLRFWRQLAEWRADLRHKLGIDKVNLPAVEDGKDLPPFSVVLNMPDTDALHEAFRDSCLSQIWDADLVNMVREFTAEVAMNAIQHGGATSVSLKICWDRVELRDNGGDFSPFDLTARTNGNGGFAATAPLLDRLGDVVVTHFYDDGENVTSVGFLRRTENVRDFTDCVVEVKSSENADEAFRLAAMFCSAHPNCDVVYVIAKNMMHSHTRHIEKHLGTLKDGQRAVLLSGTMSTSLRDYLRSKVPALLVRSL